MLRKLKHFYRKTRTAVTDKYALLAEIERLTKELDGERILVDKWRRDCFQWRDWYVRDFNNKKECKQCQE